MSSRTDTSKRRVADQKTDTARSLDPPLGARKRGWLLLAALVVLLPASAQLFYLVPDSAGHVAWARSFLFDQDVDFSNEYARLGMIDSEGTIRFGAPTPTGRPGNPFGMGSALLWLPGLALAALVARVAAAAGVAVATDGFGTLSLFAVHAGSWAYALAALVLVGAAIRSLLPETPRAARRAALAGAALGTPFLAYVLQLPSYSHACSAFAVALVLWLGLRWRDRWTVQRAALAGAAVGLAALVRAQDATWILLPPLFGLWGGALRERRVALPFLTVYGLAAFVTFAPQLVAWKLLYGTWWALPQGAGFLRPSAVAAVRVLVSPRHGLLAWSPVVVLALAGCFDLARTPRTRVVGAGFLALFGVQWLVNALPVDWWAGWSFGARRFVSCVPLFALGLAAFARRGRGARTAIWIVSAASLVNGLRVATRELSGEADPGWGALWGAGYWSFLPRIPGALVHLLATPWTELQVIRRPQSTPPDFAADPAALLALFYGVWAMALGLAVWIWGRRRPGRRRGQVGAGG